MIIKLFVSPQVIKDSMRHKSDLTDMSRMWVSASTRLAAAGSNGFTLKWRLAQYNSLLNLALLSSLEFPFYCGNCQRVSQRANFHYC